MQTHEHCPRENESSVRARNNLVVAKGFARDVTNLLTMNGNGAIISNAAIRSVPGNDNQSVGVLVFSDCAIFRKGLQAAEMEAHGFHLIGSTGSISDALELLESRVPSVVAIDGRGCRTLAGQFLDAVANAKRAEVSTVILNSSGRCFDVADHHLPLGIGPDTLPLALRLIRKGLQVTSPLVTPENSPMEILLSPDELEVLRLRAQGLGLKQVAARVSASESTVKRCLQRIVHKLEVENASKAVLWAAHQNLI